MYAIIFTSSSLSHICYAEEIKVKILSDIMRVVLYLLLLQLMISMVDAGNCQKKCGNVSIPYPFGIGEGCYLEGFEISCTDSKPYTRVNVEIIDISLIPAQMLVYNNINYACYDENGDLSKNHSHKYSLNFTGTPYRFSSTRNKFTAVGCRTLVYIKDVKEKNPYMSGCLSICQDQSSVVDKAPCAGMGCCQTSIPEGLAYYKVLFDPGFNHSPVFNFSPCSYAFLADQYWYQFNSSDVFYDEVFTRNSGQVPMVLDWAIGTENCERAKLNKMGDYACVSQNSDCANSNNGSGYICNCTSGYQGNPYILNGCQDMDECEDRNQSLCYGKCTNLPGGFNCSCPRWKHGDPFKQGGCQLKYVNILIAVLCSLLFAAAMYLVYEKAKLSRAKRKCFRQNGGLLLQKQINAHRSIRFKIFSIEELKKATNNFSEDRIKGRGGHGIVYEGTLNDKRKVAVKKSILTDAKKKEEFAKEMYILSLLNHKNVIQILGCCLEVEVPILVYEYLSRGTLYQHIQNKNQATPLGFRLKIAIDSASALAYLHSDALPSIVHGDIKSSNILLDDECQPKVSDFGASMFTLSDTDESGVAGTHGYIDPESLQTGRLTEKSDVYSFAVVILELLTRKQAVYSAAGAGKKSLAQTFLNVGLKEILDDEIKHEIRKEQITEFSKLLGACLREKGEERPTMAKVVSCLQKMREFDQNLSESAVETAQLVNAESSNHSTYTAQYYSSGHQAVFELDYHLKR